MTKESPDSTEQRGRGILTNSDREFLRGNKELQEQSQRDARYRIRERIKNAVIDFRIIYRRLRSGDLELVFDSLDNFDLSHVISFLFKGIHATEESFDDTVDRVEEIVETGVNLGYSGLDSKHIIEDVSVSIAVDKRRVKVEEVEDKFLKEEESLEEMRFLMRHLDDELPVDGQYLSVRFIEHLYNQGVLDESSEMEIQVDGEMIASEDYDSLTDFIEDAKKRLSKDL